MVTLKDEVDLTEEQVSGKSHTSILAVDTALSRDGNNHDEMNKYHCGFHEGVDCQSHGDMRNLKLRVRMKNHLHEDVHHPVDLPGPRMIAAEDNSEVQGMVLEGRWTPC